MSQSPPTPRSAAADSGSESGSEPIDLPQYVLDALTAASRAILPKLRTGFYTFDSLVDIAAQSIEDALADSAAAAAAAATAGSSIPAGLDDPQVAAEGLVEEAWERRREVEAAWGLAPGERTTGERLDAAFAALEARGVVARMNFTCCGTCGHAEIGDDLGEGELEGKVGYVFFHEQDADRLVPDYVEADAAAGVEEDSFESWEAKEGSDLYLAFGVFRDEEDESKAIRVGVVAAECLRAEGFKVEWNGSVNSRLLVDVQPWRKRLESEDGSQVAEDVIDEGSSGSDAEG